MDKHLNLFKFFNKKLSVEHIENNLSRALVLCLQNDNLFLHKFMESIINSGNYNEDFKYLFSNPERGSRIEIDIQKSTRDLDQTDFKRIYAIALSEIELDLSDFFELSEPKDENYKPLTDVLITVGDIIFVIEVKRSKIDCKQQLSQQVFYAASKSLDKSIVVPVNFDWLKIMSLATLTNNFNLLSENKNIFTNDFISLIRRFRPHWLPVTPFANLSENTVDDDLRNIRLESCVLASGEKLELLDKVDRIGFKFRENWADEILPRWIRENNQLFLKLFIWPANTKGQGWSVFYNKNWDWLKLEKTRLMGQEFEIDVIYEVKFSHIQGNYITSLNFTGEDLKNEINTTSNFEKYAGKHDRTNWKRFEGFLDNHFFDNYDWRKKCNYNSILESGKSFYNISLGYQAGIKVPFTFLQSIDNRDTDTSSIEQLFIECNKFYEEMLNYEDSDNLELV